MTSVIETYGLTPVETFTIAKKHCKTASTPMRQPDLYVGAELEIENFPGGIDPTPYSGAFRFEQDGSLRNGGIECITLPVQTQYLENLLEKFYNTCKISQEKHYSDRCSTHIHVNVQDMTFDQLRTVFMVYQVVERLLFAFVGNNREENIFCVPWYQSGLTANIVDKLKANPDGNVVRRWQKYSALNLLPIRSQGTLEFRHLHGTCDVQLILRWVNMLASLIKVGKEHQYDTIKDIVLNMNTISNYDMFLDMVFGPLAPIFATLPACHPSLSRGVVDAKLMLLPDKVGEAAAKEAEAAQLRRYQEIVGQLHRDVARPAPHRDMPQPQAQVVDAQRVEIRNAYDPFAVPVAPQEDMAAAHRVRYNYNAQAHEARGVVAAGVPPIPRARRPR